MASQIIQNSKLFLGAYDLSGDLNTINLDHSVQLQDNTTLGASARTRAAGLKDTKCNIEGFFNTSGVDIESVLFSNMAVNNVPVTISPIAGAAGDLAYLFKSIQSNYKPGAKIGDMFGFTADMDGDDELVRGIILDNATRAVTANGTTFNPGAILSTQKLYAALHVLAVSGSTPSLTVKIQSAAASNFASPTDRLTFTAANAIGSQWATPVSGPITDAYWRMVATISGSTPSFTFAVSMGIK